MPYGVFICLSCAGIHRSLGVHLSFVRCGAAPPPVCGGQCCASAAPLICSHCCCLQVCPLNSACDLSTDSRCRRSTTLDSWSEDQLRLMAVGGNQRARTFFKQHGWDEVRAGRAVRHRSCWTPHGWREAAALPLLLPSPKLLPPPCRTSFAWQACSSVARKHSGAYTCLLACPPHTAPQVGSDKIEAKYTSRAAQLYRKQLEKDAAKLVGVRSAALCF